MPQPIDPHTELGRMTAAERIQQIADRASLAAQARLAADAAQAQVSVESQVQQAMQKQAEVERELRRGAPYVGRRRKRSQNGAVDDQRSRHFYNAAEKDVLADDPDAHRFDVEV